MPIMIKPSGHELSEMILLKEELESITFAFDVGRQMLVVQKCMRSLPPPPPNKYDNLHNLDFSSLHLANIQTGKNYWTQGRSQDLGGGGGGQEIIFSDLGICMSRSDMLRMAKLCALLGGFGGMLPREIILKRCNLVFFRVYFDQILYLFFFKNYHFLYNK